MEDIHQFDNIRPYLDSEVSEAINRIIWEKGFINFLKIFFPEQSIRKLITDLQKVKTILEFQKQTVYPIVQRVIKSSITKFTYRGFEKIDKNKSYIFMSNHRDIVLDSAFLEYILAKNDYPTTEIAIGSNLLILNWIVDLVKLNKSFIVKRDIPRIELYKYSVNLSKYIRFALARKNSSIWLAQREGRTKDGNDFTQLAVLKMLNLSGGDDWIKSIKELNIIPLTISYEFEPLAASKVQELYNRTNNPEYKKGKLEDLTSMLQGIKAQKGHVCYTFGDPINEKLHEIEHIKNRKQRFDALKLLIDTEIYKNYHLSSFNYIAADIYFNTNKYSKNYNSEQKKQFDEYFKNTIATIKGEPKIISDMLLKIYANPVENHFKIKTN